MKGGNFQFLPLNLQIFAISSKKVQILTIFPQKNANLDNFFSKKCNFGQLSTSIVKNMGNFFHKNIQIGRTEIGSVNIKKYFPFLFTYHIVFIQEDLVAISLSSLLNSSEFKTQNSFLNLIKKIYFSFMRNSIISAMREGQPANSFFQSHMQEINFMFSQTNFMASFLNF